MKKWHLHEHENDIVDWWRDAHFEDSFPFPSKEEQQRLKFLAYERWLNNRELLTIEDGYEWQWAINPYYKDRSPAPGRPTTDPELGYSYSKVES